MKTLFRYNLDMLLMFVSVLVFDIVFQKSLGMSLTSTALWFDFFVALLFTFLMPLMGKKLRLAYSLIVVLALGLFAATQTLHYAFFTTFYSFSKLSVIKEAMGVKGEAMAKFDFKLLAYLIPFFLMIVLYFIRGNKASKIKKPLKVSVSIMLVIFSLVCSCITVINYHDEADITQSDKYLYGSLYNKVRAMNHFGLYSFEARDIVMTLTSKSSDESEETAQTLDEYLAEHGYTHEDNAYTGLFEGKNLVLVLCESLSPIAIDETLTPTLYMMQTEGISFNNHYSPVYQSATADSEFISLTSQIPSIDYGATGWTFFENSYPNSLANKLNALGYTSNSFHSFKNEFYNRNISHLNMGFEKFYAQDELYFEKREDWQDAMNWPLDRDLFNHVVNITNEFENPEPFFDFVISVSGHIPYIRERYEMEGYIWQTILRYGEADELYPIEELCYFAGQKALDDGLNTLINKLEESGKLENTVIAIYGDHYPYGLTDDAKEVFFGNLEHDYELYKTPFMIWTPGIKPLAINSVSSTFDIYPTLANLFNIDLTGNFIVGHDALGDEDCIVIFEDHSWLTNDAYYDSTNQKLEKYGAVSPEGIQETNDYVNGIIDAGQKILTTNYYAQ